MPGKHSSTGCAAGIRHDLSARRQTTGVASGAVEQSTWRSRSSRRLDGVDAQCVAHGASLSPPGQVRAYFPRPLGARPLSHRGVGDVSPKTSLVRLCLRLFSSHKVHRAHSRAPAVCNAQALCQCCCATRSLHPSDRCARRSIRLL